ncbi:GIY-YIG nuclease superfamily protein [compost metagenome]
MTEHFNQTNKCAKYTLKHEVQKLERYWETENRVLASKLEYHIKKLNKVKKENLVNDPNCLETLLGKKINCEAYNIIK